jgi:hypothetical protein
MKTKHPRKQSPQSAGSPAITPEKIRELAHRIFLERGGAPGRELDDWLLAEQELKKGCPQPLPASNSGQPMTA